jgi:hypothetical protein
MDDLEMGLEARLKRELQELHRRTLAAGNFKRYPEETEQRIDRFAEHWAKELEMARALRLEQAQATAESILTQIEVEGNVRNNALEAKALKGLDREVARLIWQSVDRSIAPSRAFNQRLEDRAKGLSLPVQDEIHRHHDELQQGLAQAVDSIREGKDPDLTFTLLQRRGGIYDPFANQLEAIASGKISEADMPAEIAKMRQVIEQMAELEKNLQPLQKR